jgi:hypothetical protein
VKDATHPGSIVGRNEAAEICGVSRQRLAVLAEGAKASASRKAVEPDPDFPAPICFIDDPPRPLWWRRSMEAYDRQRKAPKQPEQPAA